MAIRISFIWSTTAHVNEIRGRFWAHPITRLKSYIELRLILKKLGNVATRQHDVISFPTNVFLRRNVSGS